MVLGLNTKATTHNNWPILLTLSLFTSFLFLSFLDNNHWVLSPDTTQIDSHKKTKAQGIIQGKAKDAEHERV